MMRCRNDGIDVSDDIQLEFGIIDRITNADHALLKNRDLPDQHPILAIIGLEERLVAIEDKGKSAYEIAVFNGFIGTEVEWLESLKGDKGDSAYAIAVFNGFDGTETEWLESLKVQPFAIIFEGAFTAFAEVDGTNDVKLIVESIDATMLTGIVPFECLPGALFDLATEEKPGLVKSSTGVNRVSVDENGYMYVAQIDMATLVTTTDQEIILNGGTSI